MTPFDPTLEATIWDRTETATLEVSQRQYPAFDDLPLTALPYQAPALPPPPTTAPLPVVKRRAVSLRERAASGGALVGTDQVVLIPTATLPPGVAPKLGDVVITADGARRTIIEEAVNRWGQTYRAVTRDLVFSQQLDDLVDVQRPLIVTDAAGATVQVWPGAPPPCGVVLYAGLPCRVQPQRAELRDDRGIRGSEVRYDVFVSRELQLRVDDRLVWRGRFLDVVGYRQSQTLTDVPVVECLLRPGIGG